MIDRAFSRTPRAAGLALAAGIVPIVAAGQEIETDPAKNLE